MALIWREQMSVGNNVIDHDHKYLICYLNTIELAMQNPEEKEVLLSSLSQLYDYAYSHFHREEKIIEKISYPNMSDHLKEHKKLLEELIQLNNEFKFNYNVDNIKKKHDETVSFLRHWLIDHVLNTDMLMKQHLLKHPVNLS